MKKKAGLFLLFLTAFYLAGAIIYDAAVQKEKGREISGTVSRINGNYYTIQIAKTEKKSDNPQCTDENRTVQIGNHTVIEVMQPQKNVKGSKGDLKIGSFVTIQIKNNQVSSVVVGTPDASGALAKPEDIQNGDSGRPIRKQDKTKLLATKMVSNETEASDKKTYTTKKTDYSAVAVTKGGMFVIDHGSLKKTGDSSSVESSNFTGLNAVFAASGKSTAVIKNTTVTSHGEGANGIFATGEGTKITVKNVKIHTGKDSSRGLDATYKGTIHSSNVDIVTEGDHCAPVATDKGEGTVTLDHGTLSAAGDGSPCVYSTGTISVSNVVGTATGSQAAVIEGKNSITIKKSTLTGYGQNGVMLYQSTSGDAAEGTARLRCTDTTLISNSSGPMFYITNTKAAAVLKNTTLDYQSNTLVNVAGNNTNQWGTPGSNGGVFTLTGEKQQLIGNVICDKISQVAVKLKNHSTFSGMINGDKTAGKASISLDTTSVWNVSGDSYVTSLKNDTKDCSNIRSNGHSIYYDPSNPENKWLRKKTVSLKGGGKIVPLSE